MFKILIRRFSAVAAAQNATVMPLKDRVKQDLKSAMLAKQSTRTMVLKSILSEITYAEKASAQSTSGDTLAHTVVQKMIKKRMDAIQQFQAAARTDLVTKERDELSIVQTYLPAQLSSAELEAIVARVAEEVNADSVKAMGKVMKALKDRIPSGSASNEAMSKAVTSVLKARQH